MKKEPEKISCQVCREIIPKAAALHAEGGEYVHYFCKTECLNYWKEKQEKKETTRS